MHWNVWRRRWLTEPLYRRARNGVTQFSSFQQHVLLAGDAWWEAQLLSGTPDWSALTYVRPAVLSPAEKMFLEGPVARLCACLETAANQDTPLSSDELWDLLTAQKFEGMAVPAEHGGWGLSAWAQSEALRRVALRSVATAHLLASRFVFGPVGLLRAAGTRQQCERWLPRLASGDARGALASFVVENDIVPIQATGIVSRNMEGEPVLRLNWTGARHAPGPRPDLLVLPFRLHDPDGLLGADAERGVSVALLDTSVPGVIHHRNPAGSGVPWLPQGGLAAEAERGGAFDGCDVILPLSALLGGTEAVDDSLSTLLAAQSVAKGIALPALSSASISLAAHASSALMRLQAEGSGCEMLGARSRLGRLAATTYRVEAGRRFLSAALDLGYRPTLAAALFDMAIFDDVRGAMADSMDLLGTAGATPALTEWQEGLHELLPALFGLDALAPHVRNTRALALGVLRVHPYLIKEMDALEMPDTDAGCNAFDALVWKHFSLVFGSMVRAMGRAWTGGRVSPVPRLLGPVARHYRRVNRYAAALAVITEVLQPGVKPVHARNEPSLERLLRCMAALMSLCAVLKRWQDDGHHDADLPLVEWCAADAYHVLDTLLERILENLNMRGAGIMLRCLLLPPGMRALPPHDAVTLASAERLLTPSDSRERLVGQVWASHGLKHLSALEKAYECVINVHELREQIRQSGLKDWRLAHVRGGLTDTQAEALEAAEAAVLDALRG